MGIVPNPDESLIEEVGGDCDNSQHQRQSVPDELLSLVSPPHDLLVSQPFQKVECPNVDECGMGAGESTDEVEDGEFGEIRREEETQWQEDDVGGESEYSLVQEQVVLELLS